jgi:outer membrane protein assembly factor BamA
MGIDSQRWLLRAALAIAAFLFASRGSGQASEPKNAGTTEDAENTEHQTDYTTPRTDIAGFPIIGGSSDIGFQFGLVATISRFQDDIRPYRWNLDVFLSAAVKPGSGFTQEVAQSNIDIPGLYGGKLRLNPQISYTQTNNLGYFGLGNASSADVPSTAAADPKLYFQSIQHEVLFRAQARVNLGLPFDLVPLFVYRYEDPSAYTGSKLETDAMAPGSDEAPDALGLRPLSLVSIGGGIVFDTRDNEQFPHRGHYHQFGIKFVEGVPFTADVRYGQDSSVFAWFVPLGGSLVFASRALLDLQFGNVPFYDLFTGGPFKTQYMIGGSAGIRGVPIGRYLGRIKVIVNEELRAMLWHFRVFGQPFHIGTGVFFDTGRLWLDYSFKAPQDGSFPGLKWGTGVGGYLIWGQAAVFRIEVAYSPSATAFGGWPIAVYLQDNMMF